MATHYFWDEEEDNVALEYDDEGNTIATYTTEPYLYGNVISQHREGVTSHFHHDGIGSTIAVTDDNGDVTDTRAYSAFGEITESSGTTEFPYQYVGQKGYYRDEDDGNVYVRERVYQPKRARWRTLDPLLLSISDRYVYVKNSPLSRVDPSSLLCIRVGNIQYAECGIFQWAAQLVPEAADIALLKKGRIGGFIIQKICTIFLVKACPGVVSDPEQRNSSPCPAFEGGPEGLLCYWEYWPLDSRGNAAIEGVAERRVLDLFRPAALDTRETFGWYIQEGHAYFVAGDAPPDGYEAWKVDRTKPPHLLPYRCDEPSGAPQGKTVGRVVEFEWDCCVCPPKEPETTDPGFIPRGSDPFRWLSNRHFRVTGGCK